MGLPDADPEPLIEVDGVSFSFESRLVLENIDLRVQAGDFLAILGPNGSGKTTLIKIILGLLEPAAGRVRILGRPIADFKDRMAIGYIPQKATHFDSAFPASVREVVAMASRSARRRPGRRLLETEIRKALTLVGMEGSAGRPIGRLSGGEQQRVFIARAIVHRPRVLFLDEPTTGIDAETQSRFYDLLGTLNVSEGLTIVLVTHDIGIVNRHIRQVACLNQRLIYHGTHAEFCRSDTLKSFLSGGHHLISHSH